MRRQLVFLTLFLLTAGSALAATMATPHPITEKYRDAGAHPATGRSGSAAIEARALLGKDGATDIDVTTGRFEPASAPAGSLAKVQIKLLADDGSVMQTDNYKKGLTGGGNAAFSYDGLRRGQRTQVQASVTGIDPNRTDIVTIQDLVRLRPDIKAVSLAAPSEVRVNAPVVVVGTLAEMNGDLGARARCSLLIDGVQADTIPGIWIDASSSVACRFETSFATAGTRTLTVRVSEVTPGDYDPGNDEVSASIRVVDPAEPFRYFQVYAGDSQWDYEYHLQRRFTLTDGTVAATGTRDYHYAGRSQWHGAYGWFDQPSAIDEGTITLTESVNGGALTTTSVNVTDLLQQWGNGSWGCRWGMSASGFLAQVCFDPGSTQVWGEFDAVDAYYFDRASAMGSYSYYWYGNWDYSGSQQYGTFQNLGSVYHAELTYTTGARIHSGSLDAVISEVYHYDVEQPNYCWSWTWYGWGSESGCEQWHYANSSHQGWAGQ